MLATTKAVYTVDLADSGHNCTLVCNDLPARIKIGSGADTPCPLCYNEEPVWPWHLCLRCGVPIVTVLAEFGANLQYGKEVLTLINEYTYRP
jgi:hypothetical protein